MKKLIYFFSIFMVACCGCDYCIGLNGRVLSNITGEPIRDVQVRLKSRNIIVKTDSLGFFSLEDCGGGSPPKPIYTISKEGYKDFEIEFSRKSSEKIYKVKTGEKNYDLNGKFFYPDTTNLSTYFGIIEFEKYSQDFANRNDSLVVYLDVDDMDIDFDFFLKRLKNGGWNIDRYKIK